jgi:hypothetical protein
MAPLPRRWHVPFMPTSMGTSNLKTAQMWFMGTADPNARDNSVSPFALFLLIMLKLALYVITRIKHFAIEKYRNVEV